MVGFHIIIGLLIELVSGNRFCEVLKTSSNGKHLMVHTKGYELKADFFGCLNEPLSLIELEYADINEPNESTLHLFVLDQLNNSFVGELRENIDTFMKRKHYIHIMFKVNTPVENSKLNRLFQALWRKQILNVILVDDEENIFTYEPFTSHGFLVKELSPTESQNPFPDKLSNLYRHEIKVSMFHQIVRAIPMGNRYGAVDGQLAHNLLEHINATAKYIRPSDGQTYGLISDSGITGSMGDIVYAKTDVGFNSRLVDDVEKLHVETLYPVHNEIVCVLYPKSKPSPPYLNIIRAFGFNVWAIIIAFFVFVVIIFKIFRKIVRILGDPYCKKSNESFSDMELFFKVFLGEAFKDFPRVSSLRIYLITWILFSYICTTIYFARLESTFVQPAYNKDFNHLADLEHIEGNVYAPLFFLRIAEKNLNSTSLFKAVEKKTIIVQDMSKVLFLKPPKNSTFLATKQFAKYIIQQTFDFNTKRPAFHISHEYLHISSFTYIVPKGSPYIHKFEELISRYNEHGFLLYWEKMTKLEILLDSKEKPKDEEELKEIFDDDGEEEPEQNDHKVLTMDVLQGAFYLLVIGVSCAIVLFVIECYVHIKLSNELNC